MPEFIEYNRPTPPHSKPATAPRVQLHPCANCGRQVVSPTARRIYCSDLCSQVTSWIRYFQRAVVDGRSKFSDVHEALGIRLAHIAAGGYAETERQLPVELREAVKIRAGGVCQSCGDGDAGTDIDHIRGSSTDLSNLQLLCRKCHNLKTHESIVSAEQDVIETVHKPIQRRAFESPHRQPCDSIEWRHGLWAKGAREVSSDLRTAWSSWIAGAGSGPPDPATAVAGFPPELDPWAWYLGERPEGGSDSSYDAWRTLSPEWEIPLEIEQFINFNESTSASLPAEFWEEQNKHMEEVQRRAVAIANLPVVNSRPFRAPVVGKGKWHTSYADVSGCVMPPWVVDPERSPACGSRSVKLDLESEAFYTTVGEQRSEHTDRLCGNCVRIE